MKKEFEFINWLRARQNKGHTNLLTGIGDDAAIFLPSSNCEILISTDLLAEDIHFKLDFTPPNLLGHKSLAVNLSDIAAMGGKALYFLLSVACPKNLPEKFLTEFINGILTFAEETNVVLIGGDTSASQSKIFINITVIGESVSGQSIKRSGAKPGDEVYVTGQLGASALGLQLLQQGKRFTNSDLTQQEHLALLAHLKPQPKLALGFLLGNKKIVSSMIDVSDGLSSDLGHICEESSVGAIIDASSLPLFPGASLSQALNGGEDYELLFTIAPRQTRQLQEISKFFPNVAITKIGTITQETERWLLEKNQKNLLLTKGYDHFA